MPVLQDATANYYHAQFHRLERGIRSSGSSDGGNEENRPISRLIPPQASRPQRAGGCRDRQAPSNIERPTTYRIWTVGEWWSSCLIASLSLPLFSFSLFSLVIARLLAFGHAGCEGSLGGWLSDPIAERFISAADCLVLIYAVQTS